MSLEFDNRTRVTVSPNVNTIDSVIGPYQNGAYQQLSELKYAPYRHTQFSFVGLEAPTASTYPDSVAPIGSCFTWLQAVDGVIVGASKLYKSASNSWTAETASSRDIAALGTTAAIDGDTFESTTLNLKTITATAGGTIGAGTQLVIGGDPFTVVQGGIVTASGTAIVEVDAKVTATDGDLVSATNQALAFSGESTLIFQAGEAMALNLPPVAEAQGVKFIIVNGSGNTVTVDPDGGELIDGAATLAVLDATQVQIVALAGGWASSAL